MKKIEIFKVEGDKIIRVRRHCPKCGSGVFLAEHKNRYSCGLCGYTEFKSGIKEQTAKLINKFEEKKPEVPEEKPPEEPGKEPEVSKDQL